MRSASYRQQAARATGAERFIKRDQDATGSLRHGKQPRVRPDLWRSLAADRFFAEPLIDLRRLSDEKDSVVVVKAQE